MHTYIHTSIFDTCIFPIHIYQLIINFRTYMYNYVYLGIIDANPRKYDWLTLVPGLGE